MKHQKNCVYVLVSYDEFQEYLSILKRISARSNAPYSKAISVVGISGDWESERVSDFCHRSHCLCRTDDKEINRGKPGGWFPILASFQENKCNGRQKL